jgi:hypothetical protein
MSASERLRSREGLRDAIEEMTEMKLVACNRKPLG